MDARFDSVAAVSDDASQSFGQIAQQLVAAGEFHRLFDLRLVEGRHALGLPLEATTALDELEEPLRTEVESRYLAACRETGQLLLEANRAREAWMYLRAAGERAAVRAWLSRAVPDESSSDELIELALTDGVDPPRGFAWLLAHRGTCNAVTEMEAAAGRLPPEDQAACAAVLVRHMHEELLTNLRGHLERLGKSPPPGDSIAAIIDEFPELFDDDAYHIDTSHLASAVRFARLLTESKDVNQAIELALYGTKLPADLQYPDQPPFEDTYAAHLKLLRATLGEDVDAAVEYFSERAREDNDRPFDTGPLETYLILLTRVGRAGEALAAHAELVAPERQLSPHAPTLLQLAQASGDWQQYEEICRTRGDLVAFAVGRLSQR